jgi:glycosyltransferase involved in cell wall biosynthesis
MTVYVVDIEAVDSRYTAQWQSHVPALLRQTGHEVTVISGPHDIPAATTPGAFLNFGGTNVYKANQVEQIARLFCAGKIQDGDYFLFTDSWHPGIINLKYMSGLLGVNIRIGALWHAGNYDPNDFLGRLTGDTSWVKHAEQSFFHAIDHNYFATDFHIDMFARNLLGDVTAIAKLTDIGKVIRTGWPMEYMSDTLAQYNDMPKRDLILFPHRIAPEKQVEIFRDIAHWLPQYEFVVCQDQRLSKHEYHTLLGQAKMVFSASLQETLGIGCFEGAVLGAIPLVPDRLSYTEMYESEFKYPTNWTTDFNNYTKYRPDLTRKIQTLMDNYNTHTDLVATQAHSLSKDFFSADIMLRKMQ